MALKITEDKLQDANLSALTRLWLGLCVAFQLEENEAADLMYQHISKFEDARKGSNEQSNFPRHLWQNANITWETLMKGLALLQLSSAQINVTMVNKYGDRIAEIWEIMPENEPRSTTKAIPKPANSTRALVVPNDEVKNDCNNYLAFIIRDLLAKRLINWLEYDFLIKDYSLNEDVQKRTGDSPQTLKTQAKSYLLKGNLRFSDFISSLSVLGYHTIDIQLSIQRGERKGWAIAHFNNISA